jgi:hypothetical protein
MSAKRFLKPPLRHAAAVTAICMVGLAATAESLFADPAFEHGFRLTGTSHAQIELNGSLLPPGARDAWAPRWRLAQWGSRVPLMPGVFEVGEDGSWRAANEAKTVVLSRDDQVTLRLEVHGIREYGEHLRQFGEPWPHLLVEQRFADPIRVADHTALPFQLAFRVTRCMPAAWFMDDLDPGLHTAHVNAFWTVHPMRNGVVASNEMIWFGIPLFDARHAIPPGHRALDTGAPDASGKFICTLDGERFWDTPTGNRQWHALSVDLKPLLAEALAISQEHGHLKDATLDELVLTSFNLGWELPGPYDAAIEVRGLRLGKE